MSMSLLTSVVVCAKIYWRQVAAGGARTCAVSTQNKLHCSGLNEYGQTDIPADLGEVAMVATDWQDTCALK